MFELGTDGPRRILVGVDGSATSLNAASYAAGLARRQSSHLVVLYVSRMVNTSAALASAAGMALPEVDDYADELERLIAARSAEAGLSAELVHRRGNPYEQLVAVAEELRVDAIVVGASRAAGHRVVGSLAGRLVRNARWPVTVVP